MVFCYDKMAEMAKTEEKLSMQSSTGREDRFYFAEGMEDMDISSLISDKVRSIPTPKMAAFFNLPPDVISLGLGEPGFLHIVGDGAGRDRGHTLRQDLLSSQQRLRRAERKNFRIPRRAF